MKKLLSISYSTSAFNIALLILRVGAGVLLAAHGYDKLIHFQQYAGQFVNFLGIGQTTSLSLTIFAEFFCSIFVILGLFTRIAAIPIIINMAVAVGKGHNYDFFGKGEPASLFFLIFLAILLVGPGKASIDGAMNK
jgi:putative oxidoreductase